MMLSSLRARSVFLALAVLLLLGLLAPFGHLAAAQIPPPPLAAPEQPMPFRPPEWGDLYPALICLPISAVLGAALALRPKRRGTPTRTPAVVQTQIILAVVGAVIMLVIGASLARAFGIVGAANLIRYRSKIDDPKDAGVMLCCLAVGLASGVGLFALAVFSTAFLILALAIIESFEPTKSQQFELKVAVSNDAADLRPRLEQLLNRFQIENSLRTASSEELSYDVKVPYEVETDNVTNAIQKMAKDDKLAVEWGEKKLKKA
jgi:uncharacterized membrane protein YhiD involved in acid resistance